MNSPSAPKYSDCSYAHLAKKYRLRKIGGAEEPRVDREVNAGWIFVG
jgi:hypothetical protein